MKDGGRWSSPKEPESNRGVSAAVKGTGRIMVITQHEEYFSIAEKDLQTMRTRIIVDGRNVFDETEEWIRSGFVYRGVGKGQANKQTRTGG